MNTPESRTATRWCAPGCGAFSLLELLIVMAILATLALMVTLMVGNTTVTIKQAEKRMDADAQARLVFDRMARDFQGMTRRADISFLFDFRPGNDALYFFSEATGHFADNDPHGTDTAARNTLSLVGYRVSDAISTNARFEMERLGRGLHWFDFAPTPTGDSTAVCYLPATIAVNFSAPLADPYNNSSNLRSAAGSAVPQWDVIGDQVIRMECCLLLKDGTFSAIPVTKPKGGSGAITYVAADAPPTAADDAGRGYAAGWRWYDQTHRVGYICKNASSGSAVWSPLGLQDVSAVIVAIAVIDGRSRLLASTEALSRFSAALPDFDPGNLSTDPSGNPRLMSVLWQEAVNQPSFARQMGLPASAASGVRIYQRYFYF
ncbi:MAG: prepilin-type N-terminal cleavage/methylation domain-containing protein [Chthoniobacteraceae bacterium]|nr:prepilin-type N-terminal cleavage/methylation domain-containing protein [Chthoniobacteraceae bacterium]